MALLETAPLESMPAVFAQRLAGFGDRVAIVTGKEELTYADLASRVEAFAQRLGTARRLVLVSGTNTVDTLVAYLGAQLGGHPVLLTAPDAAETLIEAYDPDVVVRDGATLHERHVEPAHLLHPDLALLLSTSGSTGSPKLVRLSHANLRANAESIAEFLRIGEDDRAATTLPVFYSYGLSVVNSYLLRGASLWLTDGSVADPTFWESFREHECTSFAGVPHTFDLLSRTGFDRMRLPRLRYVTQAGGRLAPDRVRHYAQLGRHNGWDFVVMYGQTEATARMAYLPPELAADHPECVGVPIPGGSIRLEPGTGEIVYAGPNVMLGYATGPSELSLGRTVEELHTGDLGRLTPDGLLEIVGRTNRFAKVFGLRIDLQRVEARLQRHGVTAQCLGGDDRLTVVAQGEDLDAGWVRGVVARESRLPSHAVKVHTVAALPRKANGKPDHQAVHALLNPPASPAAPTELTALYAQILDRQDVTPASTFVSLGGDSLSYVEMSIRLEQVLGHLPPDWHTTPIGELRPPANARKSTTIDTGVALRAVGIVLIVGTHAGLFGIPGAAHLLLGLAGFNFGRFHLTAADRMSRVRGTARSIGRIAGASMFWIALAALLFTDAYHLRHILLLHNVIGPTRVFNDFWFIEALVYIMLVVLALMAVPGIDRVERRWPFGLPMTLMALGLVTRYQVIPGVKLATPLIVFWLFVLGWAAAKATSAPQRWVVTIAALATIPGLHGDLAREAVIAAGLIVLIWVPSMPSHPWVNRAAGALAGASLYIYLTHWQVFPRLDQHSVLLAVVASLVAGIGYRWIASGAATTVTAAYRRAYAKSVQRPGS